MTRQLTITATEWASVQDSALWLVRPKRGEEWTMGPDPQKVADLPPVEFVQASAPCETCHDERAVFCPDCGERGARECVGDGKPHVDCPDCRIELVGPCYQDPWCCGCDIGHVLGHAYAVGEPLPIVQVPFLNVRQTPYDFARGHTGPLIEVTQNGRVLLWTHHDGGFRDITAALAHAGPPESLVGKWAIKLRVVGS